MIYISTGCSKFKNIFDNINEIISWGFSNIELTGNLTSFEMSEFKTFHDSTLLKNNIKLRVHNYFPAPSKSFVLNLSADGEIHHKTLQLIDEAVQFSRLINDPVYGIHSGFRLCPRPDELGKVLKNTTMITEDEAYLNMNNSLDFLVQKYTDIQFYVENNVYSQQNLKRFKNTNPFLVCLPQQFHQIKNSSIKPLLDIGHLKVSCNSLGINFETSLIEYLKISDYIHVSDNNGLADENLALKTDSKLFEILNQNKDLLKNKVFTIEVYSGQSEVLETHQSLLNLLE